MEPSLEYPLQIEYRDTSSLRKEGEAGVYVDRLNTGISKNGETLNAEDLLGNTAVILNNRNTGMSYLAVSEMGITGEQSLKMKELVSGEYDLIIVVGKDSFQDFASVSNPNSGYMEDFTK